MNIQIYTFLKYLFLFLFGVFLTIFGELHIFVAMSFFVNLIMSFRTFSFNITRKKRTLVIILYFILTFIQSLVFGYLYRQNLYSETKEVLRNVFATLIIYFPIALERNITFKKYVSLYFTPIDEIKTISFARAKKIQDIIEENIDDVKKVIDIFDEDMVRELGEELVKNRSHKYINYNTVSDDYFEIARESLSDENVYIVVSNTGSNASEIISIFTNKVHNHVSIAFDSDLKTLVSYNGGNNFNPPGLNKEVLSFFNQKEDSSIIVYSLPCTRQQKEIMINKVKALDEEGSAYNLLGLVFKTSLRPNILFCSQFVYKLLETVNLNYFTKEDGLVKPTDFVELDYYRKLKFEYELFLKDVFADK